VGFGLLFIPILGGYLFIRRCHWQRFTGSREGGYHLLFRSAIAGACLLLLAWLLTLLEPFLQKCWLVRTWSDIRPFPYAGTLGLTLAFGPVTAWLVNLFYGQDKAAIKGMVKGNDSMEQLLFESAYYDDYLVEITLCSGKVYAGIVLGSAAIRDRKYVEIMPFASGYRATKTLKIHFTTNYPDVLDFQKIEWRDYRVVIPISEIRTARPFKMDVYDQFKEYSRPPT